MRSGAMILQRVRASVSVRDARRSDYLSNHSRRYNGRYFHERVYVEIFTMPYRSSRSTSPSTSSQRQSCRAAYPSTSFILVAIYIKADHRICARAIVMCREREVSKDSHAKCSVFHGGIARLLSVCHNVTIDMPPLMPSRCGSVAAQSRAKPSASPGCRLSLLVIFYAPHTPARYSTAMALSPTHHESDAARRKQYAEPGACATR